MVDLLPEHYVVDISGDCNLRCALCPQGQNLHYQPRRRMSFEDFHKLSQSLLPYAKTIVLANWSEPFLNKEIFPIVEYVKQVNTKILVYLHSNGNVITKKVADQIVASGVDFLSITFSGMSQGVYQRYHRNGKLERVIAAIRYLTAAKQRSKYGRPHLTIIYLLFPYNFASKRELAGWFRRQLQDELLFEQVDDICVLRGCAMGSQLSYEQRRQGYGAFATGFTIPIRLRSRCRRALHSPVIRADGSVFPCCAMEYNSAFSMGNLWEQDFPTIWHSQRYRIFRKNFREGSNPLCNRCTLYYPKYKLKWDRYFPERLKARTAVETLRLLDVMMHWDQCFLGNFFYRSLWSKIYLRY